MKLPIPRTSGAWIRFTLAFGMLVLILYYLSLTITNRVAIESRVNAEVLPEVAQIDGVIHGKVPPRGSVVHKGDLLASIRSNRVDDRTLSEVSSALDAAQLRTANLQSVITRLTQEHDELSKRHEQQNQLMAQRVSAVGNELAASFRSAKEDYYQALHAMRRGKKLSQSNNISDSQYENLAHDYERAQASLSRLQALIDQNEADKAAVSHGVTLTGNYADTPYLIQRMDEIQLKLIDYTGQLRDLQASIAELTQRKQAEADRIAKLSLQDIHAHVDGVVWRAHQKAGIETLRGSTILSLIDCETVFVEATVYERFLDQIAIGQTAKVQLLGYSEVMDVEVVTILGSSINLHANENVAVPMRKNPGEATVVLKFNSVDQVKNYPMCGVGRTAEVFFTEETVSQTLKNWLP